MVPVTFKLQNELLLDLARNLRQERLLIGSERQNLQTLNQKVSMLFHLSISQSCEGFFGSGVLGHSNKLIVLPSYS
jgi:hypothetical protein